MTATFYAVMQNDYKIEIHSTLWGWNFKVLDGGHVVAASVRKYDTANEAEFQGRLKAVKKYHDKSAK